MGCLKLTYYDKGRALEKSSLFIEKGLEKNAGAEKKCVKGYRYGFNGQERDNEWKGDGNSIAYEARIYDPRLGRFLSRDPWESKYAWQTPYAYYGNSPIAKVDWNGYGEGDGDPPKNNLGAPERSLESLKGSKATPVPEAQVKTSKNFQSRTKSGSYNYYWVPNGGTNIRQVEIDGQKKPVIDGAYYAVPLFEKTVKVMTDPGNEAVEANSTAAVYGWSIEDVVPQFSNEISVNRLPASTFINRLANYRAADVGDGPTTQNINYSVLLTFNSTSAAAYNNSIISFHQSSGISVSSQISNDLKFNKPHELHPAYNANFEFRYQMFYDQVFFSWDVVVPATFTPAIEYVAPTFMFKKQWTEY